ncbi:hypothetical protein IIC38_08840 [candidate division KSB1 bacterium]|nr:hypothetical protein [candidate division KSB1 bacterium]
MAKSKGVYAKTGCRTFFDYFFIFFMYGDSFKPVRKILFFIRSTGLRTLLPPW